MTHKLNPNLCAPAAIAAVLALTSTPLAAQAAAPTIVLPDVTTSAPAPAAAPAAAPATSVNVSEPVVQAVPQAEPAPEPQPARAAAAPAAAPRSEAAPRRAAAERTVAAPVAAAAPAAAAPAPVEPVAADPAPLAVAPVEPAPAPIASEPLPTDSAPAEGDGSEALVAGGAIAGLGLLGFLAFRRRRKPVKEGRVAVVEKPRVSDPVPAAAVAAPAAMAATPIRQPNAASPVTAGRAAAAGSGAVALPDRMPSTFEERDRLLRSLVAAKPDRANPFRSPKARFKRARLIMQSLGQSFADRDPQIDLSDYPQHWPEVARRRYATAA